MIDPLTLDQMRALVVVAETGSFSAAARRLGRVQSAISQSIQTMEATLGVTLFDRSTRTPALTDAGQAIVNDARAVLEGAKAMRTHAESIASDVEPDMTLAVDSMFPTPLLMASLEALRGEFPDLPATVFTEALGGSEQRLREGAAKMAIYTVLGGAARDLSTQFLTRIALTPVVAASHPLAAVAGPLDREALEPYVQLVLTDRTDVTRNISGGVIASRVWRFADLSTRLEFLLGGFGWCNMPLHMVEKHILAGQLRRLTLAGSPEVELPLYVVHERGRRIGRAGRWLIDDLRARLQTCPGAHQRLDNHRPEADDHVA
jgi:DNA-binding transcriptional LysR family regulator